MLNCIYTRKLRHNCEKSNLNIQVTVKKNLVLLGMMGAGKTSIGKIVAKKQCLEFIDTDSNIEKSCKMEISKIFKEKGEIFFRKVEEKISLEILKKNNIVIALGGGAFLNKKIMEEILKNHLSFWLKWNDKVLIQRIKNSQKRPLAFNLDDNELTNLIKKRSKIYSKAKFKINCNNLTKNQIINKVLYIYEKN